MQAIELKSKHRVCKNSKGVQRSVGGFDSATQPRLATQSDRLHRSTISGDPITRFASDFRFPSVTIRHEITAGLAYKQFGLIISQPVLKNKWGSEVVVVQAKGKGVFENGKVGISRDFNKSQVCQVSMTSSQPRSVIASSKLNRMQITANDPNWRFPSNTTP